MTPKEFQNNVIEMRPILHAFAMSLTHDTDQANDLVQETYLKIFDKRESFVNHTNLKSWSFTILKNVFINNYRSDKMHTTKIKIVSDVYKSLLGNISPESCYVEKEIRKLIQSLHPHLREPFQLYLDGYKYEEITIILNKSMSAIKTRIFRARKILQIIITK